MKGAIAGLLLALAITALVSEPARAITCGDVDMSLVPCVAFLTGQQMSPSPACCSGIQHLKALAPTTADHRFACDCVKQAAAKFQNLKDDAVGSLAQLCGTAVPFPISLQVDCTCIP